MRLLVICLAIAACAAKPLERDRAEAILKQELRWKSGGVVPIAGVRDCGADCTGGGCSVFPQLVAAKLVTVGACAGGAMTATPTDEGKKDCYGADCSSLETMHVALVSMTWPSTVVNEDLEHVTFAARWEPSATGLATGATGGPAEGLTLAGYTRRPDGWHLTFLPTERTHGSHPAF